MARDAIRRKTSLKKEHARKYINSTGGLLKKRISKRALRYALTFQEDEFKRRKGLSKLWAIPDLPIKALLKRIKRNGIRKEERFKSYSIEQIIEIFEKGTDHLTCFYFLDKYAKKMLLTNAFLAANDDSLNKYFFGFLNEEKERLIKEYKQMKQAQEPFELLPDLIEDIDDIFRKKLLPMISVKTLSEILMRKDDLLDDAETLECCLMMLPDFAPQHFRLFEQNETMILECIKFSEIEDLKAKVKMAVKARKLKQSKQGSGLFP